MDLQQIFGLILLLTVQCECKTEIGDYIVDCSACNSVPVQGVSSYSCKVRCNAESEASENLTTLYDVVTKLSQQLETMTKNLENMTKNYEEVTKELEETKNKLKKEVVFSVRLNTDLTFALNEKIIFNKVISNVGNAYDSDNGTFIVPYNGTYELTLTTMGTTRAPANIMINDKGLCQAYSKEGSIIGICTTRQNLIEGDEIWLQSRANAEYKAGYNSFSGHLLHLD